MQIPNPISYSDIDVYYTFIDGIKSLGFYFLIAVIASLVCLVIAFIAGLRRFDCLSYFITSIAVKTSALIAYFILIPIWLKKINFHSNSLTLSFIIFLILLILCSIIENIIFRRVLKDKDNHKYLAFICNFIMLLIIIILGFLLIIFY